MASQRHRVGAGMNRSVRELVMEEGREGGKGGREGGREGRDGVMEIIREGGRELWS